MLRASALSAGNLGMMFSCIFRRSGQTDSAAYRKAKPSSFPSAKAPRASRPRTFRPSKGNTQLPGARELPLGSWFFPRTAIPSSAGIADLMREIMKNTKFVVKVNRGGTRGIEYVQRVDRKPVQTTVQRDLALMMGKF